MTLQVLNTLPSLCPGAEARREFPIFLRDWKGRLCYLDTAASSQKPRCVINRVSCFYADEHSNVHRGAYALSAQATERYEEARAIVASFIRAKRPEEVVFTRGTTESINLVAHGCEHMLREGDSILLTVLEHHSNIVPWQLLAERKKLKILFADVTDDGALNMDDMRHKIAQHRPTIVACTQLSNALGTVVPIKEVIAHAHQFGAKVLVDAAQSVVHAALDVADLDADFAAFSGHKIYGPTGIGVLYAKHEHLESMQPFMGGGDMIREVTTSGSTWAPPPAKFEAGTPPIAQALGLGTAIEFVASMGAERIRAHERSVFEAAFEMLSREAGVTVYGPATRGGPQESIVSFNVAGVHSHDLATIADSFNVQIRAGHHCAMPLLSRLGIGSSARVSFGVYSTLEDLPPLIEAVRYARKLFS